MRILTPLLSCVCVCVFACFMCVHLQNLSSVCDFPILQSAMMQAIERYMKQAIVARNPTVASAALVSSLVSDIV